MDLTGVASLDSQSKVVYVRQVRSYTVLDSLSHFTVLALMQRLRDWVVETESYTVSHTFSRGGIKI